MGTEMAEMPGDIGLGVPVFGTVKVGRVVVTPRSGAMFPGPYGNVGCKQSSHIPDFSG